MIPFTRYWVNPDDHLSPIGCGLRTVRVTFRKKDVLIRELWSEETSTHLSFGAWNEIPHLQIAAGQTIGEVIKGLRDYKATETKDA